MNYNKYLALEDWLNHLSPDVPMKFWSDLLPCEKESETAKAERIKEAEEKRARKAAKKKAT